MFLKQEGPVKEEDAQSPVLKPPNKLSDLRPPLGPQDIRVDSPNHLSHSYVFIECLLCAKLCAR